MASRAVRAANHAVKSAAPHMKKVWSSYTFQRGVQEQMLSPFEVNIAGPEQLKGFLKKAQWMMQDRGHLLFPPIIVSVLTIWWIKHLRHEYLLSHRD
ncbi:hypothetical protein FNF29_02507 [Cafeteria roenbergensis]|nr:hypothetical protein FNF31_07299 [Cafeteria roenbergensis]KAA0154287.1 hypothetical protein FNF29_02507 [Cafeteria roenbergensis]KAA0158493.1 hypothetical protein FNF28_06196 [Cafeteria roenbergensis]|eukprot:KAA0154287.1 hypothetical protein FNF29_02507 [Cafeteria roenbergensis]